MSESFTRRLPALLREGGQVRYMTALSTYFAYQHLEQTFSAWAQTQAAFLAAIVVGSRARLDPPADKWSDLDVIVFTTDASSYTADGEWLKRLGEVWVAALNQTGSGEPEWLVLYAGGLKLDVMLRSVGSPANALTQMLDGFPYQDVFRRGVRVLFDRTAASQAPAVQREDRNLAPAVSQGQLTALVNRALLDAVKTAKFIRRQDLWRAKQVCDCELKQHLLSLLEWHAAAGDAARDIWYDGRYLDLWADARAVSALPSTFAKYDADDLRRALFATLDLFRRLAQETAARLGYEYPAQAERLVAEHIQAILNHDD